MNNSLKLKNKFKLYISPYTLYFKNKQCPPLEGSLLAIDFGSGLTGYSDFLPWPIFGESNLSNQLKAIKEGYFSNRFLIAKHNAFLDAQARSQKRNLLSGLRLPSSHFLIDNLLHFKTEERILEKGFQVVKVKLNPDRRNEQLEKLKALYSRLKNIKWRLDLSGQKWSLWKERLHFIKKELDFVEDPNLTQVEKEDKNLLAQDWIPSSHFQIKIIKPSRDSTKSLLKELSLSHWKRLIFTHSFDHPLGQTATAFHAGIFYKNHPRFFETGALTHSLSQIGSYFLQQGPDFVPPAGFGFGFSDSLKKEPWKRSL